MVNHLELRSNALDVLACVKISEVYRLLGGPELRRTRGLAFWRGGDGYSVSFDDSRGVWHDFVTGQGGGLLDLIVQARGGSRADALRWVAGVANVALDNQPLSAEDRARWAQERRELPEARYWHRAAVSLAEEVLAGLKGALVDGTLPQARIGEIANMESALQRFRKAGGAGLVTEFTWWREHYPGLAAGMVRAATTREQVERRAVAAYLRKSDRPKRRA